MRWGLRRAAVCTLASMTLGAALGMDGPQYYFLGAVHALCVLPCGAYSRRSWDAMVWIGFLCVFFPSWGMYTCLLVGHVLAQPFHVLGYGPSVPAAPMLAMGSAVVWGLLLLILFPTVRMVAMVWGASLLATIPGWIDPSDAAIDPVTRLWHLLVPPVILLEAVLSRRAGLRGLDDADGHMDRAMQQGEG